MAQAAKPAPTAFISYSHDSQEHADWVCNLAIRLRQDGVDVKLDQWDAGLGDQLPAFMERAIRDNDFVLIVCTPKYKLKSELRIGGVGYEGDIIQSEVFARGNNRKFIPILRNGQWIESAPAHLVGKAYIALNLADFGPNYRHLLRTLHGENERAPSLGKKPDFSWQSNREPGVRALLGHTGFLKGVAISADGRTAVSVGSDSTMRIWDVETGRERHCVKDGEYEYGGGDTCTFCIAITPDGKRAVSGSGKKLRAWDLESGEAMQTCLISGYDPVYSVALTQNDRFAVFGSSCGWLGLFALETGLLSNKIKAHSRWFRSEILGVAVTADGKVAVSASGDKTLKVWEVESGRELRTLYGHSARVHGVAMTSDGQLAISASGDGTLKVWKPESGIELRTLTGHTDGVQDVAMTADGKIAVSASDDRTLKVWDVNSGQELQTLVGHHKGVSGVAMTPDARIVVSCSFDHTVRVWNL